MIQIELPEGMDQQRLLKLLKGQCRSAIGFDQDQELNEDRARALDYYKGRHEGYVAKDLPVEGEGRSKVVTSEVADAIETALPDLMEVFTTGDDVLTFRPLGKDDIEQAKQETDMVRHVFFNENNGWKILYNAFKDAMLSKNGIIKFYWDATPEYEEYETEADEFELEQLEAMGVEITEISEEPNLDGKYEVTARKMIRNGRIVVANVAPENFAVSANTVELPESDYTSERTNPTIQELRERRYDEEKIQALTEADDTDEDVTYSRDTAYEHSDEEDVGDDDFKEVEVYEHYIRLDGQGDGELQLYRVVTDSHQKSILEVEKRSQVEYASLCPYPMPHRFYGQSVADKIVPIAKWKTSVSRLVNDAFAFNLHARPEIGKDEIVPEVTLEQLNDHAPGNYFVTKTGKGVHMHRSTADPAHYMAMLEYVSTVGESRTGIVRNAQGLKPDTMHKTKGGAEMLVGAAQKRIRLMARQFAEGGLRDLFMGIHELLRSNATMAQTVQLRGEWIEVSPSRWRRRNDMSVHIGVGSGGRDQELMAAREFTGVLERIAKAEAGGIDGVIFTRKQLYNWGDYIADRLGIRSAERFIRDPESQEVQMEQYQKQMAAQNQPDPEVQKMQMELHQDQQKFMAKMSLEQQKEYLKDRREQLKLDTETRLAVRQQDTEAALRREEAANPNIRPVDFGGQIG